MQDIVDDDRRSHPRPEPGGRCLVTLRHEGGDMPCRLGNISSGGVMLQLPPHCDVDVLPFGVVVSLVDVPPAMTGALEGAQGRVAWCTGAQAGICFDDVLPISADDIMDMLERAC